MGDDELARAHPMLSEYIPIPLRGLRRRLRSVIRPISTPFDPYDRDAREDLAKRLYERASSNDNKANGLFGSLERGQLMLRIIEEGFPIPSVTTEYFRNLERLLQTTRKQQKVAGQVLLGVGTGRCGSTSLSALLGTVPESCCTHENPPLIFWKPEPEQLQFHMKRLRILAQYFTFVSDVSHWWLNVLGEFLKEFPNGKIIGLVRDPDECVKSFMRIRGYGRGSWNHWATYANEIWSSHGWDPTYPTYPTPEDSFKNPDRTKRAMIERYVHEYNDRLAALAAELPDQLLLVGTEALNRTDEQWKIFRFAGASGRLSSRRLNLNSVADARSSQFKF